MKENNDLFIQNLVEDSSFKNWVLNTNKNDIYFWNTWIKNNPEKVHHIYTAKAIVQGIAFEKQPMSEAYLNAKLGEVLQNITAKTTKPARTTKQRFIGKRLNQFAAAVAAVALLFISYSVLNTNQVSYKTGYGETLNIKLSDGTGVVLNGNSEISYAKDNPRDIYLKGEAYFKVKPIPATRAKFFVKTDDITVQVFGTQFNVRARGTKTDVLLDEGAINLVLKNGENKQMTPGEVVTYSEKEVTHNKIHKALKYTQWKDHTYVFNKMPLVEVMNYIEETYGLASEFESKALESLLISGGIPNENLKICLAAIQKSVGVNIEVHKNKLTITKTP